MNRKYVFILAFLLIFLLAFAPPFQGVQRFQTVITQRLTVTNSATIQDATLTDAILTDATITGGSFVGRSVFLRYQDVAAAPAIRAEATTVATVVALSSEILGIETPRNVVLTYVTATTATVGSVTVVGIDARGLAASELIAVAAISGSQTLTGVVPWQSITSFTLPTRTEDVTLTVAGGQLFGLPIVPAAAADLYHLTVNETPQAAPTVDTTYGTFNPVSTPAADVDYNVWMKQ